MNEFDDFGELPDLGGCLLFVGVCLVSLAGWAVAITALLWWVL